MCFLFFKRFFELFLIYKNEDYDPTNYQNYDYVFTVSLCGQPST